jgi:hypothetical protein
VRRFYAAINHRDYRTAWTLGGKNLGNRTYAAFAAGFADTDHDDLRITAVRGQLVDVRLVATQDGGTRQTIYTGAYRVVGGQIIHGRLRVIRATGGSSAGTCDPAYPDVYIPRHRPTWTALTSTHASSQSCRPIPTAWTPTMTELAVNARREGSFGSAASHSAPRRKCPDRNRPPACPSW